MFIEPMYPMIEIELVYLLGTKYHLANSSNYIIYLILTPHYHLYVPTLLQGENDELWHVIWDDGDEEDFDILQLVAGMSIV